MRLWWNDKRKKKCHRLLTRHNSKFNYGYRIKWFWAWLWLDTLDERKMRMNVCITNFALKIITKIMSICSEWQQRGKKYMKKWKENEINLKLNDKCVYVYVCMCVCVWEDDKSKKKWDFFIFSIFSMFLKRK